MSATPDPYASYGGTVASGSGADPYAAYGGAVAASAPAEKSLLQRAKDKFDALTTVTPEQEKGHSWLTNKAQEFGAGAIQGLAAPIVHPLDTIGAVGSAIAHPIDTAVALGKSAIANPAQTAGNLVGGAILGEAAAPVVRATSDVVKAAPDAYRSARAGVVGGSKLDEVITGDTVTPRQRYEAAKAQGVNLDTAQATNAPVAGAAKKITEHSLGGASKFEENNAANVKALQDHSQKLLDTASPAEMSREDFGNKVKSSLLQDQQKLNETSADLYKKLDADIGTSTPDSTPVRDAAKKIVDANKAYYESHPDLLSGGAGKAWRIVNNLADSGDVPAPKTVTSPILDASGGKITSEVPGKAPRQDTWSDLHKLRSDLLDITRGPEIIGDRPTGWIKQLTGAVDDTMTKAADADNVGEFRDANDIYKHMKQTYDDPTSRLYHVVRSPDGLTAANTLANITPDVARKIGSAAPELLPQLQRQTISRILNPAGNDLPDLKNLSSRLSRAQKEQLAGVLTPEQIKSLDDLGRTSKLVTFDSNPSGSGKVVQKSGEAGALGIGAMKILGGVATANPVAVAEGAAPFAYTGAQRIAASRLTSPAFTDAVMNPPLKGKALWAKQGAAKLADSGLTAKDIETLSATPQGKSLLIRASSLSPGSPAMKDLVKKITP